MKKSLHLGSVEDYDCLMEGNCVQVDSIDDANEYKEVRVGIRSGLKLWNIISNTFLLISRSKQWIRSE